MEGRVPPPPSVRRGIWRAVRVLYRPGGPWESGVASPLLLAEIPAGQHASPHGVAPVVVVVLVVLTPRPLPPRNVHRRHHLGLLELASLGGAPTPRAASGGSSTSICPSRRAWAVYWSHRGSGFLLGAHPDSFPCRPESDPPCARPAVFRLSSSWPLPCRPPAGGGPLTPGAGSIVVRGRVGTLTSRSWLTPARRSFAKSRPFRTNVRNTALATEGRYTAERPIRPNDTVLRRLAPVPRERRIMNDTVNLAGSRLIVSRR